MVAYMFYLYYTCLVSLLGPYAQIVVALPMVLGFGTWTCSWHGWLVGWLVGWLASWLVGLWWCGNLPQFAYQPVYGTLLYTKDPLINVRTSYAWFVQV